MRAIKDILKCTLGNETLWTTEAVRRNNINVFLISVPAYTDYSHKLLSLRLLYLRHGFHYDTNSLHHLNVILFDKRK